MGEWGVTKSDEKSFLPYILIHCSVDLVTLEKFLMIVLLLNVHFLDGE